MNREQLAEKQRAYYEANREKLAEKQRAYRDANREQIAEQKRAYYEANREKLRAYREARLVCGACGERMRALSDSGLCGFCVEELGGRISA